MLRALNHTNSVFINKLKNEHIYTEKNWWEEIGYKIYESELNILLNEATKKLNLAFREFKDAEKKKIFLTYSSLRKNKQRNYS